MGIGPESPACSHLHYLKPGAQGAHLVGAHIHRCMRAHDLIISANSGIEEITELTGKTEPIFSSGLFPPWPMV